MNTLWAVPRHRRPNPLLSRLRSLGAVVGLGGGLVATSVLSGLVARSLLTPFTDDVQLTAADERSCAGLATSQTSKGFEQVDVRFDRRDAPHEQDG